MQLRLKIFGFLSALLIILNTGACNGQSEPAQVSGVEKLKVVSTTTIVGDVVYQVGGEEIDLTTLLAPGADPHSFEPSPRDIADIADADVVFANGAGLETFLDKLIESAGAQEKVVYVSDGITLLEFEGDNWQHEDGDETDAEHQDGNGDPHTWTDPNNVIVWVDNITKRLSELDPDNAGAYQANAQTYLNELRALDNWIRQQVNQIPVENRKMVSDHAMFGYFSQAYGIQQVGSIIPGYSSLSEPSAQELAQLEDAILEFDVKAVFVGNTVNPDTATRVAADTGVQLVFLYTGSLTESGGEADDYIQYMRYNVNAIVNALK